MMRSLSSFSIDDSPVIFDPNLSSMREVSDTETIIFVDQVLTESDSNQSMPSIISSDSGTSKNKGKKSKLQTESKAMLKKARQEKDKLRKRALRANETEEKRAERLEKGRIYAQQRRQIEKRTVNEKRLHQQKQRTDRDRKNESSLDAVNRLKEQEIRSKSNRLKETQDEINERLKDQVERTRLNRYNESQTDTEIRLDQDALRHLEVRLNEKEDAYVTRLEKQRLRNQRNRANETPEQTALRQQKDRDRHRAVYRPTVETAEERDTRLGLNREKRYNAQFQLDSYLAASFDPDQPYNDDPEILPVHYCGSFDQICVNCGAMYNMHETNADGTFTRCCKLGVINLPIIRDYHPVLVNYLTHLDDKWDTVQQHFYENIRQYNSKLAFAGIQTNFDPVNYDNAYRNKRGYIYKCHGNMYFNFPPLFNDPASTYPPQTAQYYMMDTDTAHLQRTKAWYNDNGLINDQILRKLEDLIHSSNIYYRFFN